MTVKVVVFDLFETLVSEFDARHPSITENVTQFLAKHIHLAES